MSEVEDRNYDAWMEELRTKVREGKIEYDSEYCYVTIGDIVFLMNPYEIPISDRVIWNHFEIEDGLWEEGEEIYHDGTKVTLWRKPDEQTKPD